MLTEGWENKYKPRSEKDSDIVGQLRLVEQLLKDSNIQTVSLPDMEADDVMASYAKQFAGKVTLLTGDKDMRQCLSGKCNILKDVTWEQHQETGQFVPKYDWVSAKAHVETGMTYNSTKIAGITPEQWPHFQALVGDSTDGIKGCEGIGAKGAMKLILDHGSVQGVIAACKDNNADLSEIKRLAVLDFEEIANAMLLLTTLVTDLKVPEPTLLNVDGWDE
jgi:DNA polymerase-1